MSELRARSVLLNIDVGELADEPEGLYRAAHVVSIACGGHAGSDASMARALAACARHRTRAGAHPSYPDRPNFGRREMQMSVEDVERTVAEQCSRLLGHARAAGLVLGHVKPHGALYHAANGAPALARAVVRGAVAVLGPAVAVVGPPQGALADAAGAAGVTFWREGFADRGLRPDGALIPRGETGALLGSPPAAAAQAVRLAATGAFDTLCVHGDSPGALAIALAVRSALEAEAECAGAGHHSGPEPGMVWMGDAAWRWELPEGIDRRRLGEALRSWPGVQDAVVAEAHASILFEPGRPPSLDWENLCSLREGTGTGSTRAFRIAVRYDGADLGAVARAVGVSEAEVIALHTGAAYEVRVIGFLPGFAYLGGLDPRLRLPRRAVPRPRVPAGAVGIAAGYSGVYPLASPGGWHLLGTALDFAPFSAELGAAWAVGDRVRFEAA